MKLVFSSEYLSIDRFNDVDIPDISILTGVNGSGKSHLLEAIEKRSVHIDGLQEARIVHFDYLKFKMENERETSGQQIATEQDSAWQFYESNLKQSILSIKNQNIKIYELIEEEAIKTGKSFWDVGGEKLNSYKDIFERYMRAEIDSSHPHFVINGIISLAKVLNFSIDKIEKKQFIDLYKPYSVKNSFLPAQLGRVFWDYYIKLSENKSILHNNRDYNKDNPFLSDEEFVEKHGEKPWELANKILETFDTIPYRFRSPEGLGPFKKFKLDLIHKEKSDLKVDFERLSSGERVLMALVASIYKASSDNYFPDILLLDEIDASLHPSMMQNMLRVMNDIFAPKGMKIILVTHSATTVALAPEDSICVMNSSGPNRIERKSQQEALAILTQGFATLEQGLKIFDQVAKANLTIISEGRNINYLEKYFSLEGIKDVELLRGSEDKSGKNQLKVLFDFFVAAQPKKPVLFILDCDVDFNLKDNGNIFSLKFQRNMSNNIANSGIENLFDEILFEGFTSTMSNPDQPPIYSFYSNKKRQFEHLVLSRNDKSDFNNFSSIKEKVENIRSGNTKSRSQC